MIHLGDLRTLNAAGPQLGFSLDDEAETDKTRMVGQGIYFGLPKVFLLLDILTVLAVPATGQEGKNQTTNATRVEYMLLNKMDQKKKHMTVNND